MKRARTRNNIESPTHIQIEREIKPARTIPMRNASENHISGSWVSCSCMRLGLEGIAACIVVFHHSIELKGLDTILLGTNCYRKGTNKLYGPRKPILVRSTTGARQCQLIQLQIVWGIDSLTSNFICDNIHNIANLTVTEVLRDRNIPVRSTVLHLE